MFCNSCGKQLPDAAKFCGACGTAVASSSVKGTGEQSGVSDDNAAKYIYGLYFLAYLTAGLSAVVGVIWAYSKINHASSVDRSHFEYQIATFWKSLLLSIAVPILLALQLVAQAKSGAFNTATALTGIAVILVGLAIFIFMGVRTYKGFSLLGQPIADPKCRWIPTSR